MSKIPMERFAVWTINGLYCCLGRDMLDGMTQHPFLSVDAVDVLAAIEAEGWCGCDIQGTPAVVLPVGGGLTRHHMEYLRQGQGS